MSTSSNSHFDQKLAAIRKVPAKTATSIVAAFCKCLKKVAPSGVLYHWRLDRSEDNAVLAQLDMIHNTLLGLTQDYVHCQEQAAATYCTAVKSLLVHLHIYKSTCATTG